jgi:hypothetical protein
MPIVGALPAMRRLRKPISPAQSSGVLVVASSAGSSGRQ